ncbi:efflux RND transporter periplasmic adaptor subunit [Sphingobacterium bovistauri]|uniref:Efflux RND transporter periplasmic adaptor subunit n=1 Tax=Sphingobacterium bovistauri TaxID=2781959 RepID=A0ABS7Z031_9SPHI|nr:efflux RND transporter periplasmic adaptor subunit [Sphingobacterium bovistauri]MCA5003538.1 efflux RND transporter periplasmic adaptor subunit [Sphingobacterium bovistauri]
MKFNNILICCILFCAISYSCDTNTRKEGTKVKEEKVDEHNKEAPKTIAELNADQIKAVGIELSTLTKMNITSSNKINGILRVPNSNKASVAALFGGVVNSVNVQDGDYVKKGQVLATISNPEFIDVQEQYLTVNNQLLYAEQEFERQQELFNNDAGAKKNLQSAATELKKLKTQKASLIKRLQMMGITTSSISNTNIRNGMAIVAPISGTISRINAQVGAYVDVSSPVAEIIDNSSIHLDLQVFERNIGDITLGQQVDFKLTNSPEKSYKATVYKIGASFENDSKTISVHCSIQGDRTGLIDGMNAVGLINLANNLTLAVPTAAIVDVEGKSYIFIKTDKEADEHNESSHDDHGHSHDEGEESHNHSNESESAAHANTQKNNVRFEKIEIAKGASDQGYTAIVPVVELPEHTIVVTKGAFFINAKLSDTGGHSH